MPGPLGFSAVPAELKPITAFVQRAEELKASEPVVAYWCTYYAAQLGIAQGAKGAAARAFLGELLGTLENMKLNISASDPEAKEVIDHETASAAYVEGFALKVFGMADNEDRAGKATRGTAKKFLAAANFIEVLKVFDQPDLVETNADKARYAKWKAADIARAFREGRQPLPGPADASPEPTTLELPSADLPPPGHAPHTPRPASATPHIAPGDIEAANAGAQRHDALMSPGQWSTLATPGADTPVVTPGPGAIFGAIGDRPRSPVRRAPSASRPRADGTAAHLRPGEAEAPPGRAESTASIVDGDTAATAFPHASANAQALGIAPEEYPGFDGGTAVEPPSEASPRGAHFSPEVRGLSMVSSTTVVAAPTPSKLIPPFNPMSPPPALSAPDMAPDDPVATRTPFVPSSPLPPGFVPTSYSPLTPAAAAGMPPPPVLFHHSPQPSAPPYLPHGPPAYPPRQPSAPPPPPPPELTPQVIAKIQRHCRFAVSALDYEDGEQARKELRAALAMLGG